MNALVRLQEWYLAQCNDDWEHQYGITIETLDNPGWRMQVTLKDTNLMGKPFESIKWEKSDDDWILCRVVNGEFEGVGGPLNLGDVAQCFVEWALGS